MQHCNKGILHRLITPAQCISYGVYLAYILGIDLANFLGIHFQFGSTETWPIIDGLSMQYLCSTGCIVLQTRFTNKYLN